MQYTIFSCDLILLAEVNKIFPHTPAVHYICNFRLIKVITCCKKICLIKIFWPLNKHISSLV